MFGEQNRGSERTGARITVIAGPTSVKSIVELHSWTQLKELLSHVYFICRLSCFCD
jgi:hypothetical protein